MEPLQGKMTHPQGPLHPALKVLGRRALLQVPQMGSLWKEMSFSRAFSTYPSGSPAKEPPLHIPLTELPFPEPPFNYLSVFPVNKQTAHDT